MTERDPSEELQLLLRALRRPSPGLIAQARCSSDEERAALISGPIAALAPGAVVVQTARPGAMFELAPDDALVHLIPPDDPDEAEAWWLAANRGRDRIAQRAGMTLLWIRPSEYGRAAFIAPDLFSVVTGAYVLDGVGVNHLFTSAPAPPELLARARRDYHEALDLMRVAFAPQLGWVKRSEFVVQRRSRASLASDYADAFISGVGLVASGAGSRTLHEDVALKTLVQRRLPLLVDAGRWELALRGGASGWSAVSRAMSSLSRPYAGERACRWHRLLIFGGPWRWGDRRALWWLTHEVGKLSTDFQVRSLASLTAKDDREAALHGWLPPFTLPEAQLLLTRRLGSPEAAAACLAALPPDDGERHPSQYFPLDLLGVAALWERDGHIPAALPARHRAIAELHLSQHVDPVDLPVATDLLGALSEALGDDNQVTQAQAVEVGRQALSAHDQRDAVASWLGQLSRPEGPLVNQFGVFRARYPHLLRAHRAAA